MDMADASTEAGVKRSTDDTPRQINEIVEKCRNACNSYREFSDELNALVKDQDRIFQQHQDLLEEAYAELKARIDLCPSLHSVASSCLSFLATIHVC